MANPTNEIGKNKPGSFCRHFTVATGDALLPDRIAGYNLNLFCKGAGAGSTELQTSFDGGTSWVTFKTIDDASGAWHFYLGPCHYLKFVNKTPGFLVHVVGLVPGL